MRKFKFVILQRICFVIGTILAFQNTSAQTVNETTAWLVRIKAIVITEHSAMNLLYRLDTLKSEFIPSRSGLQDYLNREIDLGFKHRRITLELNYSRYQIDLLCLHDSIFLSTIGIIDYYQQNKINFKKYDTLTILTFLAKRNAVYHSKKSVEQLIREISFPEVYAFNCGDGDPKTERGKYIDQLVEEENAGPLIDMVNSFNCETQAFGVAGLKMLGKKGYDIPVEIKRIMEHIRKRNSELVICSGCIVGIVNRIY